MKTLQQPNTPRIKPTDSFDAVSGLSLCGGIPRMGDNVVDIEYPTPKPVERGSRRAAAYAKFQSDAAAAAKSMGQRCQYTTSVSYFPATNPNFLQNVQTRICSTAKLASIDAAAASTYLNVSDVSDVSSEQIPVLVNALKTLRIQLIIDLSMSVDELRALCEETSRAEAVAYAAAYDPTSVQPRPDNDPFVIKYVFVKRTRMDLESEYQRCQRKFNVQSPTPHARIASIDRQPVVWLSHVISSDTLARIFVSVNALMLAISADVQQFLICPRRGSDRVALVAAIATIAVSV